MADENNIKSVLNALAAEENMSAILNAEAKSDDALKAYHPAGDTSSFSAGSATESATSPKKSSSKSKAENKPSRFKDGRLDTRNMTADQLADRYEAKGSPQHHNQNLETADEQESDAASGDGKKKSIREQTREALEEAKDKINDFKNNIMDRAASREKWKQVLDKAQHDDNWEKNRMPKWSTKLLMKGSNDMEARRALQNFESGDKWIKKTARYQKMRVAAHGSLKAAEQTMEGIKSEREFMAEEAKQIKKAKKKLILEKHPVGRFLIWLGLDRFIDTENGLISKIFDR